MDRLTREQRSRNMSAVRAKNTKPEMYVRSVLHGAGFRYSLHRSDLPGKPDIVFPKHRLAIFVNGCFWHGHNCSKGKRPKTNSEFWRKKLDGNIDRDAKNYAALEASGWDVIVIWECAIDVGIQCALNHLGEVTRRQPR